MTHQHAATTAEMYIGGKWMANGTSTVVSIDPATEEPIAEIPVGDRRHVDTAVDAARDAAEQWRATPWTKRAAALRELAARLDERVEELALLDTRESGNPITGMRGDIRGAANELRYFAGIAGETKGDSFPEAPDTLSLTTLEPYGVVGRIVPFNHPLKFGAGKSAAPLAAGNAVVLKPSELTSLSTLEFARLADDVLPAGLLNVVTGPGEPTGAAIVEHPEIPRIAFTGSVPSGRAVLRAAAEHIKAVTLELGGKNPLIVFPDVDPKLAAAAAVDGMNFRRSMGQSCMSQSRVLVHADVKDAFVDELVAIVEGLRVGDPTSDETDMGPLAFEAHYRRVLDYIETGKREGAALVCGGARPPGLDRGFYVQPTVFTEVGEDMTIAQEEIFGPVMSIIEWRDYEAMLATANRVEYGLTANIWTNDLSLAQRTARRVQGGLVWVNGRGRKPVGTPFGGYKHSGLGREGSLEELLSYTQRKSIVLHAL
jgi:betaine-aldehyde dehydrogenase